MRSHQMFIDGEYEAPMMYDPDANRYWCSACKRTAQTLSFIGNEPVLLYRADPIELPRGFVTVVPCGCRFESGDKGWILING